MPRYEESIAWRWELVNDYKHMGSFAKVAKAHGTSKRVVKKWVERAKATSTVEDKFRCGRPRAKLFSKEAVEAIERGVEQQKCVPQITEDVKNATGIKSLHPETVRKHMKKWVGRPLTEKPKPQLTDAHVAARLEFATIHKYKVWEHVVFTDCKVFWLAPKGRGRKPWVKWGDMAPYTLEKGRASRCMHMQA